MSKLIWIGLGVPLAMLLTLSSIRLVQHDSGFGPVALTAAGLYMVVATPVCAWLNAKGFSFPRAPGYSFGLVAFFGLSMMVRGLELVRGAAALVVTAMGTAALLVAGFVSLRKRW